MRWVAPTEEDTANQTLEKRLWAAAPVFFVDQGPLREGAIDVERHFPRNIKNSLDTVATYGVRVVLIDTGDNAIGRRLLKRSSKDDVDFLGPRQLEQASQYFLKTSRESAKSSHTKE